MTLADIRQFPNHFSAHVVFREGTRTGFQDCHESLLRSYQILEKVKELLEKQTPPTVILEIIADLQAAPGINLESPKP